ncbi:hypothetical protein Tco_1007843 [Tanacetum coccineum]
MLLYNRTWVVPVKPNAPFASVVRRCGGGAAAVATTVEGEGDVGGCQPRRWGPTGEGHDGDVVLMPAVE